MLPYARDRKLKDVLYARHANNGLHRLCRVDKRQCAARVLLGKPPPQLDRLLTAEDVRRMARMEANKQIVRKFGYRVHSRPSAESAALNQQTMVAPNDFLGSKCLDPAPGHSGKSVLCPRSVPATKRFIRPSVAPESLLQKSHEEFVSHHQVKGATFRMSAQCPFLIRQQPTRHIAATAAPAKTKGT